MRLQPMLGLWCLLAACAGPAYVPADTSDPDREVTCTGTIAAFASLPGGDFELRVTPRPDDARLLAKGQTDILCTIPANRRNPYTKILARLKVGSPIEVSGYWVTATATGQNEVRSVTSLDAFPDRR